MHAKLVLLIAILAILQQPAQFVHLAILLEQIMLLVSRVVVLDNIGVQQVLAVLIALCNI